MLLYYVNINISAYVKSINCPKCTAILSKRDYFHYIRTSINARIMQTNYKNLSMNQIC